MADGGRAGGREDRRPPLNQSNGTFFFQAKRGYGEKAERGTIILNSAPFDLYFPPTPLPALGDGEGGGGGRLRLDQTCMSLS